MALQPGSRFSNCFAFRRLLFLILTISCFSSAGRGLQIDARERIESRNSEESRARDYERAHPEAAREVRRKFGFESESDYLFPKTKLGQEALKEPSKGLGRWMLADGIGPSGAKSASSIRPAWRRSLLDPTYPHVEPPSLALTEKQDLSAFDALNVRVLEELGMYRPLFSFAPEGQQKGLGRDSLLRTRPAASLFAGPPTAAPLGEDRRSKAVSVTRLRNGVEIFTVFDVAHPEQGGRTFTLSAKDRHAEKPLRAELTGAKRIYHYGSVPRQFPLGKLALEQGEETVRRTAYTTRNLSELEYSLDEVDARKLDKESVTLLNGLPSDQDSARKLGVMAGPPEAWVGFHREVNDLLPGFGREMPVTHEAFKHELVNGDSDVMLLVAHADGIRIFLNGTVVTHDDIRGMADRQKPLDRQRVAVLVSCDAGAEMKSSSFFIKKDIQNLAEVLLQKGFASVVIAPDHKIRKDETLQVIQRLRNGLKTSDLPLGWEKITRESPPQGENNHDQIPT